MSIYARIVDGVVWEIIEPMVWPDDLPDVGGQEIPIAQRFTAEFCRECIDITNVSPRPEQGWLYDGTAFSEPTS